MKKGNSKKKGNLYEIKIARILSKWYKPDGKDYFWRTAGSGAKATITKRAESPFVGDITFLPDPERLVPIIEVKNRKGVTFDNINTDSFLPTKFYQETIEKSKLIGINKPVWIIFKIYNYNTDYIYLNIDMRYTVKTFNFLINTKKFIICTLEEFLDRIDPYFLLCGE